MSTSYTQAQKDFLANAYRRLSIKALTPLFNKTFNVSKTPTQLFSLVKRLKIKSGRTGRFEKGHLPHPNARPKGACSTSFKKGHQPHNWLPVGSQRLTEGNVMVKIAEPNKWISKQRLVYRNCVGQIQLNEVVRFKDGDPFNFTPANLIKVTRSVNMYMNKLDYSEQPAELKPTVLNLSTLQSKLSEVKHETHKSNP